MIRFKSKLLFLFQAAAQELAPELNTGRYIPPTLRAAAVAAASGTGPALGTERRRMEGYSIRVTNLPENTSEADLRDIFGRFGEVIRIFPAKDKRTQLNRVCLFSSYYSGAHHYPFDLANRLFPVLILGLCIYFLC